MPGYNTKFELNVEDLELIESALRKAGGVANDNALDATAVQDLLGRLHNQKVFYRPRSGVYVGG